MKISVKFKNQDSEGQKEGFFEPFKEEFLKPQTSGRRSPDPWALSGNLGGPLSAVFVFNVSSGPLSFNEQNTKGFGLLIDWDIAYDFKRFVDCSYTLLELEPANYNMGHGQYLEYDTMIKLFFAVSPGVH